MLQCDLMLNWPHPDSLRCKSGHTYANSCMWQKKTYSDIQTHNQITKTNGKNQRQDDAYSLNWKCIPCEKEVQSFDVWTNKEWFIKMFEVNCIKTLNFLQLTDFGRNLGESKSGRGVGDPINHEWCHCSRLTCLGWWTLLTSVAPFHGQHKQGPLAAPSHHQTFVSLDKIKWRNVIAFAEIQCNQQAFLASNFDKRHRAN